MKDIVPKDSRYIPFTQAHYCCVPTCISMIMYKHGIPLVPQELLGHYLGLTVPKEDARYFWNARAGQRPAGGWGVQTYAKKFELNKILKQLKIPFIVSTRYISEFTDQGFINYLKDIETKNKDVLAAFDHRVLNKKRSTKFGTHQGHMCLIDRVDLKKNEVRLIDPSYNQPKWRIVRIGELKRAMDWHHPESARFLEFKKK